MRVNPKHDPLARPLGCNGKYGQSAYKMHRRAGTEPCKRDLVSQAHYKREFHRGNGKPRRLKPCGTWAAASRHRRNNEPLDFACSVAEAQYQQSRRDREKGKAVECEHEYVNNQGVCEECEQTIENWEPNDAQIFARYGQTKEIQKAA